MPLSSTCGVVLSARTSGESDRLLVVFTETFGKKRFIAKGLEKTKSRSRVAAEAGSIVRISFNYNETRDIYVISEIEPVNVFITVRENLERLLCMHYILEVVDKTSADSDASGYVYRLLASALAVLEKDDYPRNVLLYFVLHLARFHGILPDMMHCKKCGSTEYSRFTLGEHDLLAVCESCSPYHEHYFDVSIKDFLNTVFNLKFKDALHDSVDQNEVLDVLFLCTLYIERYFHIEVKSKSLVFSNTMMQGDVCVPCAGDER